MDLDNQLELWREGKRQDIERTAAAGIAVPRRSDELADSKSIGRIDDRQARRAPGKSRPRKRPSIAKDQVSAVADVTSLALDPWTLT